ncbi:class I SAM-dependent methyltransferase [Desulforapulum autotrophicum]|nr:methyltransferase domain-containing protein [Desulforapulum autotrophicum]
MFSLERFREEYNVEETRYQVAGLSFDFFVPKKIDPFINQDDLFTNFPLWSKIWEATAVLSFHLSTITPDPGKRFLEIGAGMGVAGLVGAKLGHSMTITEYNTDAIKFARANAVLNNIDTVDIRELDWNNPLIEGKFDYIIGSEVVFKEKDILGLHQLFQRYLKPGGTIILAEGMRKTTMAFVKHMENHYTLAIKKQTMKSNGKEIPIILFKLT